MSRDDASPLMHVDVVLSAPMCNAPPALHGACRAFAADPYPDPDPVMRRRCCTSSWRCSASSTGTASASACAARLRWTRFPTPSVRPYPNLCAADGAQVVLVALAAARCALRRAAAAQRR